MDCAVLPVVVIASLLRSYVLADRGAPNSVYILQSTTSHLAPHPRLKRGWVWNELFVEEEDPILRVIGKVLYSPSIPFLLLSSLSLNAYGMGVTNEMDITNITLFVSLSTAQI